MVIIETVKDVIFLILRPAPPNSLTAKCIVKNGRARRLGRNSYIDGGFLRSDLIIDGSGPGSLKIARNYDSSPLMTVTVNVIDDDLRNSFLVIA